MPVNYHSSNWSSSTLDSTMPGEVYHWHWGLEAPWESPVALTPPRRRQRRQCIQRALPARKIPWHPALLDIGGYHLSIIFWLLGSTTPINRPWIVNPGLTLNDLEMMLAICSDLKHNMFQVQASHLSGPGGPWTQVHPAKLHKERYKSFTKPTVVILQSLSNVQKLETRQFCAAKDL